MDESFEDFAQEHGLVRVGGDLRPATLLAAYCRGEFPWYDESWPICWWSPDPRAVFELGQFHVSRRLARTLRSGKFTVTVNRAFGAIIHGCGDRAEGTWLTAGMVHAYRRLHRLGHAHSVEVWHGDTLAGGLYGVAIGGFFAGESMFTRVRDASKVALAFTRDRLVRLGFELFDTQFLTEHTARMGATLIPRNDYLDRLHRALRKPVRFVEE
jgi:leucyl/phenylalanyl-tRNA---protein transferase